MNTLLRRALLLALVFSSVSPPCCAAPSRSGPEAGELTPLPADLLRKLNRAVARQAAISALMANPKSRAALVQEARKLGYGDAEVLRAAETPLRVRANVARASNPDEDAFRALDWHSGVTFKSTSIPTYGPHNYRLGVLTLYPCMVTSPAPTYDTLWVAGLNSYTSAASLYVELPAEPALYTLTLKMARSGAPCCPGWLTPKPGTSHAPVEVYLVEHRGQGGPTETKLILSPHPDGIGYVGLVNASPVNSLFSSMYGMRRATARIRLELHPGSATTGEPMNWLIFHSYTLTRI